MNGPTLRQELTPIEYQLTAWVATGLSVVEIAKMLGRNYKGVHASLARIYEKTNLSDSLELATRYAWERMEEK